MLDLFLITTHNLFWLNHRPINYHIYKFIFMTQEIRMVDFKQFAIDVFNHLHDFNLLAIHFIIKNLTKCYYVLDKIIYQHHYY